MFVSTAIVIALKIMTNKIVFSNTVLSVIKHMNMWKLLLYFLLRSII